MSNEAIEVVEQEPSAFDAANSSMVLTDGWKATALIPELREQETSATPQSITASPAVTPTVDNAEVSALISTLGGTEGLQRLVAIASTEDPVALTNQLLSPEQQTQLLWNAVDNPLVQSQLLSDPDVQQFISDRFFNGVPLLEVAEAVADSNFAPDPNFEVRQAAREQAHADAAAHVQLTVFLDSGREVAQRFGLDLDSPENGVQVNRWLDQVKIFAHDNHAAIERAVQLRAAGHNLQATVLTAKLANQYKARMINLCNQLKSSPKKAVSTKAASTKKASSSNELPDLGDNFFASKFAAAIRNDLANRQ